MKMLDQDSLVCDVSDAEILAFFTARLETLCEWEMKLWRRLRRDELHSEGDDDVR